MRWSQAYIPTLRDDPADAEAASHRLLVRGGYMRQLMAGVYSLLPLGYLVREKIIRIIREEMTAIGGQEFLLPELHPREIWERTGRINTMSDIILTFEDGRGNPVVLGPTHEEIFTTLAKELTSYKQLPQLWFQVQTKFRDELRPKAGLLRVREFTMKDSYSFDVDREGLDRQYQNHYEAYTKIFERLGANAIAVVASSGAMGGSGSVEFMIPAESGEDDVVHCPACDYAANLERATSVLPAVVDGPGPEAPERFPTPGIRTIADLVEFDGGAPADRQIKTLVYLLDGEPALVLLRGDHTLVEQKLQDGTGATEFRPARPDEIVKLMGAGAGSLGAVGASGVRILADRELRGRLNMTTGANVDDHHLRGVSMERDIAVDEWLDLRAVVAGEACPECGEPLEVFRAIEAGHIFKLEAIYSEPLDATVLDANGRSVPLMMGSYGIGVGRNMAAVVEANHDDDGIVWPMSVAPYEVVVTVVKVDDAETMAAAETVYDGLVAAGVDVIIDDRRERPGVKFNDAELIGIPLRITIGPRGLGEGVVEVTDRRTGVSDQVAVDSAAAAVSARVARAR